MLNFSVFNTFYRIIGEVKTSPGPDVHNNAQVSGRVLYQDDDGDEEAQLCHTYKLLGAGGRIQEVRFFCCFFKLYYFFFY